MGNTIADAWNDPDRPWPTVAYVETTNLCNANCLACLNDKIQRPRATMTQTEFEDVADKVKARGIQIGAMFCFGEPLLDKGIEEKFRYARKIDVLAPHVGLNTNVSLLTPDRFESIIGATPNITLSFFNVGAEFERLTGGLSWEKCYRNAKQFIECRDQLGVAYPIYIGVNQVEGHDLAAVKHAFRGFDVEFVQDAELRYDGGKQVEGVLDRTRMYPDWRCDGYKGAIQIKPTLRAEFCAYDIIGVAAGITHDGWRRTTGGGETDIGHFLDDSWDKLRANFVAQWRGVTALCARCDYWHGAKALLEEMADERG